MSDLLESPKRQKRLAATPDGRQVWVPITETDRLECLRQFVHYGKARWAYFIKKREAGVPYERLEAEARCEPEQFREGLAAAWSIYETMLNDIAKRRAVLL